MLDRKSDGGVQALRTFFYGFDDVDSGVVKVLLRELFWRHTCIQDFFPDTIGALGGGFAATFLPGAVVTLQSETSG